MNWRSEEFLPPSDGTWGFWRPPFGKKSQGEANVRRAIWQWHPWDPVLISTPESNRFLPPICVPGLAKKVQENMLFQYRLLLALLMLLTMGGVIAYANTDALVFKRASIAGLLLFGFIYIQYGLVFKNIENLRELSRFVVWLYLQKTGAVLTVILIMSLAGGIQYVMQERLGGLEPLLLQYGLVFDSARHQWWRYLVGPFFHSGVVHWIGNFALAIVAAGISASIGRRHMVALIFVVGTVLPCLMVAILPQELRADAFVGISGGVFAMFGWTSGVSIRSRKQFPRHFGLLMVSFAIMAVAVSMLLNSKANDTVHVVGLMLGLLLGLGNVGSKVVTVNP